MSRRKSEGDKPGWLERASSYALLIAAVNSAYDHNCDCEACRLLRRWAESVRAPVELGPPG